MGLRVRVDGTAPIHFQVIINRVKREIPLDIHWPPDRFDEKKGCLPRKKNDPDVDAYNVAIGNGFTKANNIRKDYLIRGIPLTMDAFLKEYKTDLNKTNFIAYLEKRSAMRLKDDEIADSTYIKEKGALTKIKQFSDPLPFSDFNVGWASRFDKFLEKQGNDHNSRWSYHKIIKTYLSLAKKDNITFENPYDSFRATMVESNWGPLTFDELKVLVQAYMNWSKEPLPPMKRVNGKYQEDTRPGLTHAQIIVLRRFLFACNSALRISDLQELDRSMFTDGKMSITPRKTERYGTLIKSVPLNDIAMQMLQDEIADNPEETKIFDRYTEQYSNGLLKVIAVKVGLNKRLHHHVARYTYGSLSDEAGANHTALMKQMGIKKRDTLAKYVKTNAQRIAANVDQLNTMVNGILQS